MLCPIDSCLIKDEELIKQLLTEHKQRDARQVWVGASSGVCSKQTLDGKLLHTCCIGTLIHLFKCFIVFGENSVTCLVSDSTTCKETFLNMQIVQSVTAQVFSISLTFLPPPQRDAGDWKFVCCAHSFETLQHVIRAI